MKKGGLLFWSRALSSVCACEEVVVGGALGKRIVIGFVSTLIVFAAGCELPVEPTPCWEISGVGDRQKVRNESRMV